MLVASVLLLVPTNGLAVNDDDYSYLIETLAETRGIVVTPAQVENAVVAQVAFTVTGAFQAFMNWETNVLTVGPVADTAGESGCLAGSFGTGWANSPLGVGTPGCAYQAHPGGVHGQTLVCAGGSGCSIDALNLANFFDLAGLSCATSAGLGQIDWDANAGSAVNAVCFAFNFGFFANPPNYGSYDSITFGNGPVNLGLNNY
jgi:hypothetical protein